MQGPEKKDFFWGKSSFGTLYLGNTLILRVQPVAVITLWGKKKKKPRCREEMILEIGLGEMMSEKNKWC